MTSSLGLLLGFMTPSLRPYQGWGQSVFAKPRGKAIQSSTVGPHAPTIQKLIVILESRRRLQPWLG
ncbi:hypothetical protein Pyn_26609 [Prunus yedoensis var. nudiflora]|uniref:Uncharacterized protein n=1 Tax=Prunus yedoensis var. nudiflora TaxID=2094558 RepID=A0A314UNT1_PRUYE|nr:hypothetical protein Pyn_26609 [Prunus yedoensis var. nudiflora]